MCEWIVCVSVLIVCVCEYGCTCGVHSTLHTVHSDYFTQHSQYVRDNIHSTFETTFTVRSGLLHTTFTVQFFFYY